MSAASADPEAPDVLAIGETMLLVAPAAGAPFALGSAMTISPAGAEANVAVGCSGLGLRAAWYSRLGADAIGDLLADGLAARGVDTSLVRRTDAAPTGVMFKRPLDGRSEVAYYRAGSAASTMDAADLDVLPAPRLVHVSGITAALSDSCRRLLDAVVVERRLGSSIVSFDVNHRPVLWPSPERAATELLHLARAADVVFVGRDEAERLWGTADADAVRELLPDVPHVVVKDAEHEAVEFAGDTVVRVATPPVEVVESVGAGDGFAAGWIAASLRGEDAAGRLSAGHALAAAVLRSPTDHAAPGAGAVESHAGSVDGLE
ncbi:sugar kinase [Agromyces larvae]|uniref:Sugar kinase n=1 Tax=Agromyces larvae TaxID=2929802 RepID=A0ABY4C2N5_9MICO|nr:sugar kinase [Agromyces larvae]UOE45732.1 sugar kinase [Agromyces larvae]